MRRSSWTFAAVPTVITCAALASVAALAAGPTRTDPVQFRQGVMAVMGWNADALGDVVRRTGALDAKEFAQRAERLEALGPQIAEGFPKPGPADKGTVTDASAEIWSDAAGFQAKIDAYLTASKKLVEVAKSGDEAQMKTQYRNVMSACRGCHDKYKGD
jgi:cytochrome c556